MKKFIVLLLILIPVAVWGFGKGVGGKGIAAKNAGGAPAPTYLLSEDFDGAGDCYSGDATYNNCSGEWTINGDLDVNDFKNTLAGNDGTYSLRLAEADTTSIGITRALAGGDVTAASTYFMWNFDSFIGNRPDAIQAFLVGYNAAVDGLAWYCRWVKSGEVTCHIGTDSGSVGTFSEDTWYHIWIDYTKGSGANGTLTVTFETSATKGAADLSLVSGDGDSYGALQLRDADLESSVGQHFDKIRVDDVEIGSNPD